MKRLLKCLPLLALSLVLQSLSTNQTTTAQTNDYLIAPGQRVGRWELGKPLSVYGFGEPRSSIEQKTRDIAWNDFYTFITSPDNLTVWVFTCKSDSLVFAIMTIRQIGRTELTEATKYRTAEGIGIGTDESEVLKLLGQPPNSFDSRGVAVRGTEVAVKVYDYSGLRVRVAQTDRKVYALGATTRGGFAACQQAVVGTSPAAHRPEPSVALGAQNPLSVMTQYGVPIPKSLRMVPPGQDVPRELAAFFGKWYGRWGGSDAHILVVEEIRSNPPGATIVYAWGPPSSRGLFNGAAGREAGWRRERARFTEEGLTLRMYLYRDRYAQYYGIPRYRMQPDGTIDALYELDAGGGYNFPSRATMQRIAD